MSDNKTMISNSQIEGLTTRFFYKQSELRFQILVQLIGGHHQLYKEYSDYKTYKIDFERLQVAKNQHEDIVIP